MIRTTITVTMAEIIEPRLNHLINPEYVPFAASMLGFGTLESDILASEDMIILSLNGDPPNERSVSVKFREAQAPACF